jgi:proline iminopeptidase
MTRTTEQPLYWATYGAPGLDRLIVLHGGPGAHHDYLLPQMLALTKAAGGRELIFYDQRGGGRSKTPSGDREPITWRTHVEDLARVISEFELAAPVLVGYSWGGLLAMLYASESVRDHHVAAPSTLILIDPASISRQYRWQFEQEFARRQRSADVERLRAELAASRLRERDPEAFRQRNFEVSVAGYFADPRRARDLTPFRVMARVQESVWESLGDFDLTTDGRLSAIRARTLIVHGRQDPIPLESSSEAATAVGAKLVVLENCGHVPYVEQPQALFETINDFLAHDTR